MKWDHRSSEADLSGHANFCRKTERSKKACEKSPCRSVQSSVEQTERDGHLGTRATGNIPGCPLPLLLDFVVKKSINLWSKS